MWKPRNQTGSELQRAECDNPQSRVTGRTISAHLEGLAGSARAEIKDRVFQVEKRAWVLAQVSKQKSQKAHLGLTFRGERAEQLHWWFVSQTSASEGIRLLPRPSLCYVMQLCPHHPRHPATWPPSIPTPTPVGLPTCLCHPVTKGRTRCSRVQGPVSSAHSVEAMPTPHHTTPVVRGLCLSSVCSGWLTKTTQRKGI